MTIHAEPTIQQVIRRELQTFLCSDLRRLLEEQQETFLRAVKSTWAACNSTQVGPSHAHFVDEQLPLKQPPVLAAIQRAEEKTIRQASRSTEIDSDESQELWQLESCSSPKVEVAPEWEPVPGAVPTAFVVADGFQRSRSTSSKDSAFSTQLESSFCKADHNFRGRKSTGRSSLLSAFTRRGSARSTKTQSHNVSRYEIELQGAKADLTFDVRTPRTIRERLERIVRKAYFDQAVSVLLMVHGALIGLQVELEAKGHDAQLIFGVIDIFFCTAFALELAARAFAHGKTFWMGNEWQWNIFDTFLVLTLLGEMLTSFFMDTDKISTVLSILRIGRVIRILRMVRLIPSLKHLVYLIMASVNSFFWAAVLMLIMIYCLAVYFTMQCNSMKVHGSDDADILRLWGSLGASTLTMFMAITGGADWIELITGIGYDSPASQALFYFYVAFATMVMLNLVTGVFVQGASRIISEEKDREFIAASARVFAKFDTDLSGSITWDEFQIGASSHAQDFSSILQFSLSELRTVFELLDADDSGSINILEFIDGSLQMRGPARQYDVRLLDAHMKALRNEVKILTETLESAGMKGSEPRAGRSSFHS
eukprot:TRINITY_DN21089_c0_g1_i2.p1 TRINITY_DN21089_c0_g1~~TRINITY_DN21089_c0_g1_i2.p1  ORF type:complete len:596 (+),score=102.68 TRINITY_DN21089_c0_g1_i2:29-1816(+)